MHIQQQRPIIRIMTEKYGHHRHCRAGHHAAAECRISRGQYRGLYRTIQNTKCTDKEHASARRSARPPNNAIIAYHHQQQCLQQQHRGWTRISDASNISRKSPMNKHEEYMSHQGRVSSIEGNSGRSPPMPIYAATNRGLIRISDTVPGTV